MANYREIGGKRSYPKPAQFEPGDTMVEGKFRGELNGMYGIQYEFEDDKGEIIVLSSWGQLKYKMSFVTVGDTVKVQYEGKEEMPSGPYKGQGVHQFTVMVLDGEALEPAEDTGLDEFKGDTEFGAL